MSAGLKIFVSVRDTEVGPEYVMFAAAELLQMPQQLRRPVQDRCRVAWIRENSDEAILRQGARRPPVRVMVGEPIVRSLVMDVI